MSLITPNYFNDLIKFTNKYIISDSRDINFYTILFIIKNTYRLSIVDLNKEIYNMILKLPNYNTSELINKVKQYNNINPEQILSYDSLIKYLNLWKRFYENLNLDNIKCLAIFKKMNKNNVLFYDDNIENNYENQLCPKTIFVKIDIATKPLNKEIYNNYLNIISSKTNIMVHKLIGNGIFKNFDPSYDHNSGFNITYIRNLITYLSTSTNTIKGVIFDWDRTLTVIEGVYDYNGVDEFLSDNNLKGYDYNLSEYYFGGPIRIYFIKKLWDIFISKNIHVYVLSRNEAIISSPEMFIQLLGNIGIKIEESKLHCCYYDKLQKKSINISKYKYMEKFLPQVCL